MGLNHQKSIKMIQDAPLSNRAHPFCSRLNYSFVELLLDLYEEKGNIDYVDISRRILYDALEIPFYRKYHLFPMRDYLIFRKIFNLIRAPRTCFIGKNISIFFGLAKYGELSEDAFIINHTYNFLDAIWSNMVVDGVVYRSYQPKENNLEEPNLAAAFMYLNMLNFAYDKFRQSIHLDHARIIADKWLTQQSSLGLFPFTYNGNRSWLDSETDISISLLELYELTGEKQYYNAAKNCYDGIIQYNLESSSVDIFSGEPASPVLFRSVHPTPKFLGLFLKLAYYFESGKKIYGENGIENLIRDR